MHRLHFHFLHPTSDKSFQLLQRPYLHSTDEGVKSTLQKDLNVVITVVHSVLILYGSEHRYQQTHRFPNTIFWSISGGREWFPSYKWLIFIRVFIMQQYFEESFRKKYGNIVLNEGHPCLLATRWYMNWIKRQVSQLKRLVIWPPWTQDSYSFPLPDRTVRFWVEKDIISLCNACLRFYERNIR